MPWHSIRNTVKSQDDEELALILDSLYAEELCADDETLRAKLSSISKKISSLIQEEYEIESVEDCCEYR